MEQSLTRPQTEVRTYDVELTTGLGKRSGQLQLQLSGEMITGMLHIMKADNPLQGRLLQDGKCSLTGSIHTLTSVYPFEGSGYLLPERMEMLLNCRGDSLPLRGIRKEEELCADSIK